METLPSNKFYYTYNLKKRVKLLCPKETYLRYSSIFEVIRHFAASDHLTFDSLFHILLVSPTLTKQPAGTSGNQSVIKAWPGDLFLNFELF